MLLCIKVYAHITHYGKNKTIATSCGRESSSNDSANDDDDNGGNGTRIGNAKAFNLPHVSLEACGMLNVLCVRGDVRHAMCVV